MLRKLLTIAFVTVLLFSFGCKKTTPLPQSPVPPTDQQIPTEQTIPTEQPAPVNTPAESNAPAAPIE